MRRTVAILGLALVGAQAGHLIAYQLRFGTAAQQVQSSGPHAYFPVAAKTGVGLAALALLASLLVIAVARALPHGVTVRTVKAPSYVNLLAALFTLQLTCFVVQEVIESTVAGAPTASAASLMLWGTVGQLPAAAVLASALRPLWSRVETAVLQLRAVPPVLRWAPTPVPLVAVVARHEAVAVRLAQAARSPHPRRGPPHSS